MPIAPYNGPQYQYMGPNAYGPYPTVPMQHTDMMGMRDMHDMTPDEQLNHVKTDVNMMWENASTDQRKRIKENLLKLVNSMSV